MNKSKEVLFGVIDNYIEEMEVYSDGLQNEAYSERIKKALLSNMKETLYKLKLACKDLKKEMQR